MNPVEALQHAQIFSDLTLGEITSVAQLIQERNVAPGEVLIYEGDHAYSLFVLEEGSVEILRNSTNGQLSRITELDEGSVFGEMAFAERKPSEKKQSFLRTAGVVAQNHCRILELRYDDLERLVEKNPALGVKIYRGIAKSLNHKLKATTDHVLPLIASARLAALGQMTANIVHELNNPLTVLKNHAYLIETRLKKNPQDIEDILDSASKINATIDRISRVLAGLKTTSRDGQKDPLIDFNPSSIVRETIDFCEERLRHFSIKIETHIPTQCPLIRGRPVQLSQAFLNLLNNAVDALSELPKPQPRWIQIEITPEKNQLALFVTDSGNGISEELAEKIFKPFYTTKGLGQGTGLGLSIARQVLEENGGSLSLDRDYANTRFVIRLPLA